MFCSAYLIKCSVNEKLYVGITTQPIQKRFSQHISASRYLDCKLYRAIRKYGAEAFTVTHVASSKSVDDLKAFEVILISQLDSRRSGYNSTNGGDGCNGFEFSEATLSQMSASRKAKWDSQEYRAKISEAQKLAWSKKSHQEREVHANRARSTAIKTSPHLKRKAMTNPAQPKPHKGKGWNMKSKTHCKNGHEFSQENTRLNTSGSRVCVTCKRATRNVARDLRRAANRQFEINKCQYKETT